MACQHLTMSVASSATVRRLYALRVFCAHGMCDTALQDIYKSVVVAKLLYASSAWAGFITPADRQRVNAFFRLSTSCGFHPADIPSFKKILKASDEKLFGKINHDRQHLLYNHLPPPSSATQKYDLRPGYTIDNHLTVLVMSQTVISSPASCTVTLTNRQTYV